MTPRPVAALSSVLDPPSGGSSACPPAGARWRVRPTRRRERQPVAIFRAVPHGSVRAASQRAFLEAVEAAPALAHLRADARATVVAIARELAWSASWETMTTRPTWDRLATRTHRSRATVARVLVKLRDAGLVGVVATGRSAGYAPNPADRDAAEAAVYVLCVPSPLAAVGEHETPTPEGLFEEDPLRAREPGDRSSEPLRGRPDRAPGGAGGPVGLGVVSPRSAERLTRQLRLGRRRAQARELASRVPVLRRASDAAVAAVLREFVDAGWSTADLAKAIDWRPDGTRWPHDGATGVAQPAKWLTHRLAAWRDDAGEPRRSPSVVSLEAARERAAAQRAAAAAEVAEREAIAAAGDGPGFAAYRAALDALAIRRPR